MESGNPFCVEVTEKPQTVVRDAAACQEVPEVIIRQPTGSRSIWSNLRLMR
jgi:hypothetical protein